MLDRDDRALVGLPAVPRKARRDNRPRRASKTARTEADGG